MRDKPTASTGLPLEAGEPIALASGADEPSEADRARIHEAFSQRLLSLGVAVPPPPRVAPAPPVIGPAPQGGAQAAGASAGKAAGVGWQAAKLGTLAKVGTGIGIGMAVTLAVLAPRQRDSHPMSRSARAPSALAPAQPSPTLHGNEAPVPQAKEAPPAAEAPIVAPAERPVRASRARLAAHRPAPALEPSVQTAPPASAQTAVPAAPIDRLQAEVALIEDVRAALRSDLPVRALGMLRMHEREFPNGTLAEERAGLRVLALCASGDRARGLSERAQFLSRAPRSVLARSVRAACGEAAPASHGDDDALDPSR